MKALNTICKSVGLQSITQKTEVVLVANSKASKIIT